MRRFCPQDLTSVSCFIESVCVQPAILLVLLERAELDLAITLWAVQLLYHHGMRTVLGVMLRKETTLVPSL